MLYFCLKETFMIFGLPVHAKLGSSILYHALVPVTELLGISFIWWSINIK